MCEFLSFLVSPDFLKILIPSLIAIGVAFYSHRKAVDRNISEQRKSEKVKSISLAFKSLLLFSKNPNKNEAANGLREAAMIIQTLGTEWQISEIGKAIEAASGQRALYNLDPLLLSLRNDVRSELDLPLVQGTVYWTHPMTNED